MAKVRIPAQTVVAQKALELACEELSRSECASFYLAGREFHFRRTHEYPRTIRAKASGIMAFTDHPSENVDVQGEITVYTGHAITTESAEVKIRINIPSEARTLEGGYIYHSWDKSLALGK